MNPYGKNEEKGPTLKLAQLFGAALGTQYLNCDHCKNGERSLDELPGYQRSHPDVCPKCGRLLCGTI